MNEKLQAIVESLQARFDVQVSEFRDQTRLDASRSQLVELVTALRDEFSFELLTFITAVDSWPEESPRFTVVYGFTSIQEPLKIFLRLPVDGSEPLLPSIESIYPNANWHERETFDMFGIRFEGNSNLRRIIMPHDWEGHPLRKDYPLGYEEVQFTFNYQEIQKRKPHPQE